MNCPECNNTVVAQFDCQTWPMVMEDKTIRYMHCNGCDSAIEYFCLNLDDCTWYYIDGLNPENPRSASNESRRPDWLDGHELWVDNMTTKHPDVAWVDYYEVDDIDTTGLKAT